jgi:hypothetical protein
LLCGIGCRHNRSAQLGLATDISFEKKDELQEKTVGTMERFYHALLCSVLKLL